MESHIHCNRSRTFTAKRTSQIHCNLTVYIKDWGRVEYKWFMDLGLGWDWILTALSDDTEAVILEVSEAVIPITGRNDTLAAKEFWCVARRKTDGYL